MIFTKKSLFYPSFLPVIPSGRVFSSELFILSNRYSDNRSQFYLFNNPFRFCNTPYFRLFSTSNQFNDIYSTLKQFIRDNPINHETQTSIEEYLLNNGVSVDYKASKKLYKGLYTKQIFALLEKQQKILLNRTKKFVSSKYLFSQDDSKVSIAKLKLIDMIDAIGVKVTVQILLGRFIKILSDAKLDPENEENYTTNLTHSLGLSFYNEFLKNKILADRKDLMSKGIIKHLSDYTYTEWLEDNPSFVLEYKDTLFLCEIGAFLLDWLEDCDLVTKKHIMSDKKQRLLHIPDSGLLDQNIDFFIKPSDTSLKFLKDCSMELFLPPKRLPSIVKPKPYVQEGDKVKLGGYLLNDIEYFDPLILENYKLDKTSVISKNNIIYEAINNVNSIPFKINRTLLNFINMKPELYSKSYISNPEPLKKKASKKMKLEYQKIRSKYDLQNNIILTADLLSEVKEFYFINRIDNRGRLYCVTQYFNYQGSELAKALLLFSLPTKVSRHDTHTPKFFKSYGANCFGNKLDKMSIDAKCEWVDLHEKDILNYTNGKLIAEADHQYLFTAFCIEYKKWVNFLNNSVNTYFNTHLPIQLDASCNGFQHLVLLCGEESLRDSLNLNPSTPKSTPGDFYSYIYNKCVEYINDLKPNQAPENFDSYIRLKNFGLNRDFVKKLIMTIPYNATAKKGVEVLISYLSISEWDGEQTWYHHKEDDKNKLSYKDLFVLVSLINDQIEHYSPKITKLRKYLSKIAKICSELEVHIPWTLPSGLEVRQSYLKEKSVTLKPFDYSKSTIKISIMSKKLDISKQGRAFMPNLIHSLDAYALIKLLDKYFSNKDLKNKSIYTIHDCFAMPMGHVDFIINTLALIYTDTYSNSNYLEKLDDGILKCIKLQYGESTLENGILTIGDKKIKYPNVKEVYSKTLPVKPGNPYLLM